MGHFLGHTLANLPRSQIEVVMHRYSPILHLSKMNGTFACQMFFLNIMLHNTPHICEIIYTYLT